ncbi:MAG: FtsX-like permease family protein, partial [Acidobacteria bacterium]|nr:FtsX-like permease family protein [Acidobacteriota bacterium]
ATSLGGERLLALLSSAFGMLAALLAAVGMYGVISYSVTQRTQEIGVRTALGAGSSQVMWLFLRRAIVQLVIGLTIGVAGAFGVGKIFESTELLVQTNGRDPVTIGSIAVLLAAVSLAACVWPARRATRIDPLVALRGD